MSRFFEGIEAWETDEVKEEKRRKTLQSSPVSQIKPVSMTVSEAEAFWEKYFSQK
jgi:hypothetical protein